MLPGLVKTADSRLAVDGHQIRVTKPSSPAMDTEEVARVVDEFVERVNAGKVDGALQHYEEDPLFVPEPGTCGARVLVAQPVIRSERAAADSAARFRRGAKPFWRRKV